MKKTLSVLLVLVMLFSLCSCIYEINGPTTDALSSLEKEYSEEIAAVKLRFIVIYKQKEIDFFSLLSKNDNGPSDFDAYTIYENKLYFSYISKTDKDSSKPYKWSIASYCFETQEIQTLYETYSSNGLCWRLSDESVNGHINYKVGGLLVGDQIYLNTGNEKIVYSISLNEVENAYDDGFAFVDDYVVSENENNFIVKTPTENEYSISYSELVSKSPAAAKLSELSEHKIWNDKPVIDDKISFVQAEQQAIFVVDNVYDKSGNAYAVVYAYNTTDGSYKYVNYYFVSDPIIGNFYVVPVMHKTGDGSMVDKIN